MWTEPRRVLTAVVCAAGLTWTSPALAQEVDVVIEWNRILQVTVASTPTPTVFFTRPYALTSIAVFDALNSISPAYHPYATQVGTTGASRAAAVAQAAHDVLVALYPGQATSLATALAASHAGLPAAAAREGARVGAAAAAAILDMRRHDGWDRPPTEYLLPSLAGFYQITPPQNAAVTFSHYPDVTPFIMGSRLQFLVGPPPALTSAHYASDLNEVKALGRATGSTRTDEETSIARRWAGQGTSTALQIVWNNLLRDVARTRGFGALELARAYALLNMVLHDALQTSFNGKFLYGLWRPVTAIRAADLDGNPDTAADTEWLPLLGTPPYPTYPGNMACIAASAARLLARLFGRDDMPLTVTWTGTAGNPDITRTYNGFRQIADEEARSRVLGGIHFTFDNLASFGVCGPLADYAADNYLRPQVSGR